MYKALKSFAGKLSMTEGDVKEIFDKELIKDLTRAGYIEEVKPVKEDKKSKAKEEKVEE